MKKTTIIIMLLALSSTAHSQIANSLLRKLPPVPSNACEMTEEQKNNFRNSVSDVLKKLNELILEKSKAQKKEVERSRDQIEKNMADEYGLSAGDVQKLKDRKMSKEEKKAIADKMMQEKTGISMDEIARLKKMGKEGKKQWAEAYATQQQANLSGGSDSEKTPEQTAMEKNMNKNMNLVNLTKEQKTLTDRIAATDRKLTNKMMNLHRKDSVAQIELKKQLAPLLKRLSDLPGPSEEEAFAICKNRHSFEKNYCGLLSPDWLNILEESYIALSTYLPDYKRLAEISFELNQATLGKSLKTYEADELLELQAVKEYADNLLTSFKYAKYSSCQEGYPQDH